MTVISKEILEEAHSDYVLFFFPTALTYAKVRSLMSPQRCSRIPLLEIQIWEYVYARVLGKG